MTSGREPAGRGTDEVVYRGVKWRRSASGRIIWRNDGLRRWVAWSPGSDAPPLPEEWAAGRQPGLAAHLPGHLPGDAMSRRPPMLSPYRLVPIIIALVIVGVAVYQATRPPTRAPAADVAAAKALEGRCLARQGGTGAEPVYSATPVNCAAPDAAVKVVAVTVRGPGKAVPCPRGTTVAQVLKVGVVGEPFECLVGLRGR